MAHLNRWAKASLSFVHHSQTASMTQKQRFSSKLLQLIYGLFSTNNPKRFFYRPSHRSGRRNARQGKLIMIILLDCIEVRCWAYSVDIRKLTNMCIRGLAPFGFARHMDDKPKTDGFCMVGDGSLPCFRVADFVKLMFSHVRCVDRRFFFGVALGEMAQIKKHRLSIMTVS